MGSGICALWGGASAASAAYPYNARELACAGDIAPTLCWRDPTDAGWSETRLLRKAGGYPQNETDGALLVTSAVRDQYATNGYTDPDLPAPGTYYYQLFPCAGEAVCNNEANRFASVSANYELWQYWATLGGLDPNAYASLAALLADGEAVAALAASTPAMEYLICSPLVLQPALFASESAISMLDASDPINIPVMSDNTTPSGTAASSHVYSANFPAWHAFDGDEITSAFGTTTQNGGWWCEYDFPAGVTPWVYKARFLMLTSTGQVTYVAGKIQAYADNVWQDITDVYTTPNQASSFLDTLTPTLPHNFRAQKYRFYCTRGGYNGNSYHCGLRVLQLWGK